MRFQAIWAGVLAMPAYALAATLATATIVDGNAIVIREANKLALAEGVRLDKDDIVETQAATRLVRLEFADGVAVDLGPDTRALLAPALPGDRGRTPFKLHVLHGWVKVTVPGPQSAANGTFSSPAFDVVKVGRSAVFALLDDEAHAYAETGELVLQERRNGRPATFTLKSDEFFTRMGDLKTSVSARAAPAFIQSLPRAFLDTLPLRAELFKNKEVPPRRLGDITYADVQAWIDADALRGGFVARWKSQARDAEFRKGLVSNLKAHPEWERVLYPEKYLPKPQAKAGSEAASLHGDTPSYGAGR